MPPHPENIEAISFLEELICLQAFEVCFDALIVSHRRVMVPLEIGHSLCEGWNFRMFKLTHGAPSLSSLAIKSVRELP
jgi:hypothetical protein